MSADGRDSPNSVPRVLILNKDAQLLDAVAGAVDMRRKGGGESPDVTYYQMLHQIWRNCPGLCVQRSIALTPNLMFLCDEELCTEDVRLTVLDRYAHWFWWCIGGVLVVFWCID